MVERARARNALTRLLGTTPRSAAAALVEAVEELDPRLLQELERAVAARRSPPDGT
jgi:outer membrane protein TolC